MSKSAITLPTRQITKALDAALQSIGLDLSRIPASVADPDQRRALKTAQRATKHLDALSKALSEFAIDSDRAEAKTPRKTLLTAIEKVIPNAAKDPDEILSNIETVVRAQYGRKSLEKAASQSKRKLRGIAKTSSVRIPVSSAKLNNLNECELESSSHTIQGAAAATVRAPRRRQKPIDPLVAEMRLRRDSARD